MSEILLSSLKQSPLAESAAVTSAMTVHFVAEPVVVIAEVWNPAVGERANVNPKVGEDVNLPYPFVFESFDLGTEWVFTLFLAPLWS